MGELVYSTIASLDGYVADPQGDFSWAAPNEELHAFVNDQERATGTYLYGRRIYEVMVAWETFGLEDEPEVVRDYATIWRAADKVVFSRTLGDVASARTRIERAFDPDKVRAMKASAARDLSIGGPGLASYALRAGLVDRIHLYLVPVVVGDGTHWLPHGLRLELELLDERRFAEGAVHLHYRVEHPR